MNRTFPAAIVDAIDESGILGVRAGEPSDHRFIGIWPVVIDGRVFARSWKQKPFGWYRTFLHDPRGAIRIGTKTILVRAVPVRSTRIRDLLEVGYKKKYSTPGSRKFVRGFKTQRRRDTTMEFVPR